MKTLHRGVCRSEGGAYAAALLALAVLSAIGLALIDVTETEVRIGANERSVQRTFYVA